MRSVQTQQRFDLASVKPFERFEPYRKSCLELARKALAGATEPRKRSPAAGVPLEPFGWVEGLEYLRCPETGSLFLKQLPDWKEWAKVLEEAGRVRQSPQGFHQEIEHSRIENVYLPKLEWIQESLQLQGVRFPAFLVASPPPAFGQFLKESGFFSEVAVVDEMQLAHSGESLPKGKVKAALLLESLDRVDDPQGLICGVRSSLEQGGLLFVTSLVFSGFDMAVLGLRNRYLYPPDRTNCFTLRGLTALLERNGFELIEVSTPGVLDVEIVASHLKVDPSVPVTGFEKELIAASPEVRSAFQAFLQENGLSSFARLVARKKG